MNKLEKSDGSGDIETFSCYTDDVTEPCKQYHGPRSIQSGDTDETHYMYYLDYSVAEGAEEDLVYEDDGDLRYWILKDWCNTFSDINSDG